MTPAEGAALLRLRQMRERRTQAALLAARRAEREAAALRMGAEQAQANHSTTARQWRQLAGNRLERSGGIGGATLQLIAVEFAKLRMQENGMVMSVHKAIAVEAEQRAGAGNAAQRHAAAQRATEALQILVGKVRKAAMAAAERAEEAEMEEPHTRP